MAFFMNAPDRKNFKATKEIDKQLKLDRQKSFMDIKLLLFGSSESGKSTIMKQMRIIHSGGFTNDERKQFQPAIYSYTIQSLASIVRAMSLFDIVFTDIARESDAKMLIDVIAGGESRKPFSKELQVSMLRLWNDAGLQECFERGNEYQLDSSAKYFLNDIVRIGRGDYLPTDQDILASREHMRELAQLNFQFKGLQFVMTNVGNQRLERQKWFSVFENFDALIFCVAMSEYDQVIAGDKTKNRLLESIKDYGSMVNSKWLNYCILILFLNKKDVFEEKLKSIPLNVCFKEYTGENVYEEAAMYMAAQFTAENKRTGAEDTDFFTHFYIHHTCAQSNIDMQSRFSDVTSHIVRDRTGCCLAHSHRKYRSYTCAEVDGIRRKNMLI